jgi:hypothetical protein
MSKSLHQSVTDAYEEVAAANEPVEPTEQEHVEEVKDVEEAPREAAEPIQEDEIDAPEHWASEDRDVFRALDKRGKSFLLRRHKEMEAAHTRKLQALAEETKIAESFKKTVGPYESYLKQLNIEPTQAFEKLIATEMRLRMANPHEKAALMNELARQYGVQLQGGEAPQVHDQTKAIFDELNNHRAYLIRLEQEKKNQEVQSLHNQISTFSSAKDENGNLKYPHFETIRHDMGALMNAGKAATLEEAYEQAIWINPELRRTFIERQSADRKVGEEVRQKTAASKKAGFNVKASGSEKIKDAKPALSLNETIRRAMEEHERI